MFCRANIVIRNSNARSFFIFFYRGAPSVCLAAELFAIMCAYLICTRFVLGRHVPVNVSADTAFDECVFYRPQTTVEIPLQD